MNSSFQISSSISVLRLLPPFAASIHNERGINTKSTQQFCLHFWTSQSHGFDCVRANSVHHLNKLVGLNISHLLCILSFHV